MKKSKNELELTLEHLPPDRAVNLATKSIDHLYQVAKEPTNQNLKNFLYNDQDIRFNIEFLLYSLRLDISPKSLFVMKKWFAFPGTPDGFMDSDRLNLYIRKFFEYIHTIYGSQSQIEKPHTELCTLIQDSISTQIDPHPFEIDTWNTLLRSILYCFQINHQKNRTSICQDFLTLFIDAIKRGNLQVTEYTIHIPEFSRCCHMNSSYLDHYYTLFKMLFLDFLDQPGHRCFDMRVIKTLKLEAKNDDLAHLFQVVTQEISRRISESSQKNEFLDYYPVTAVLQLFADCAFLTKFKQNSNVPIHITSMFDMFTQAGDIELWPQIFINYLISTTKQKMTNASFTTSILNAGHTYLARNPQIMNPLISIILDNAQSISTQLDGNGWIGFLMNLYQIAVAEDNQNLISKIQKAISNLGRNETRFLSQLMALYCVTGDFPCFVSIFQHLEQEMKNSHSSLAKSALTLLILAPYFFKDLENSPELEILIDSLTAPHEGQLTNQLINPICISYFLLAIIELAQGSKLFISNRQIVEKLQVFLGSQYKTTKFRKLASYVFHFLFTGEDDRSTSGTSFSLGDRIVTVDEETVYIRSDFGKTSLQVKRINPVKEPVSEETLKPNYVRAEQLKYSLPPFHEFVELPTFQEDYPPGQLLIDLGMKPYPCNPDFTKYDQLCEPINFKLSIRTAGNQNSSRFEQFKSDLGERFNMRVCSFEFIPEQKSCDTLILFNPTNRDINVSNISESLVIEVSTIEYGLTKPILAYRIGVRKCLASPFITPEESVLNAKKSTPIDIVATRENLHIFIAMICLFNLHVPEGSTENVIINDIIERCTERTSFIKEVRIAAQKQAEN